MRKWQQWTYYICLSVLVIKIHHAAHLQWQNSYKIIHNVFVKLLYSVKPLQYEHMLEFIEIEPIWLCHFGDT